MTIKEAFDCYKRDVIQYENQSYSTESQHDLAVKSLLSFLGSDRPLVDLTFSDVRRWRNNLGLKGNCVGTIYCRIVRLRCVLAHASKNGATCIRLDQIKPPKRQRHRAPGYLTEDDIDKLIDAAASTRGKLRASRNAAIVSLMYSSGIRVGELVQLNRSDMHYDTFVVFGKGNKSRPCFVDVRARYYIDQYLQIRTDNSEALFVSDIDKERISISTVQLIFRNIRAKTGITKTITPHITRHSFATNFLRNNGNIRYLQGMLGHESLETTQIYTHVENSDLAAAHAAHHSIVAPTPKTKTKARSWRPKH